MPPFADTKFGEPGGDARTLTASPRDEARWVSVASGLRGPKSPLAMGAAGAHRAEPPDGDLAWLRQVDARTSTWAKQH